MDRSRQRQVLPFGRPLPLMIDCSPTIVIPMPTSGFVKTSWTLIQSASSGVSEESRQALATLCRAYWQPVYGFIRRHGFDGEQSRDLTQGFFTLLIEKNYLLEADRERGKFRSFLLTSVSHFLSNERDRAQALKRGGGQPPVSIDLAEAEAWHPPAARESETPESLFERRWALSVLHRVMTKLREEFIASGKETDFERLVPFLNKDSETGYETVAREMGVSAGALRVSVHRMRRRYRHLLREEIAETVSRPEEIDDEIRFLVSVLSS
jgi:DNA-directed RNA polymerase specialized sigma24 family protein